MRLTDEKITDIKEYLNRSIKVTASSLIPQLSKYGLDLIDTIEALQQENEQLQAQLDEWKYEAKCHMDEVVARDKEIEKLRAQVARMREALKQAGKAIYDLRYTLNYFKNKSGLKPYDNMTQAQEALAEIDKALGGKEDV